MHIKFKHQCVVFSDCRNPQALPFPDIFLSLALFMTSIAGVGKCERQEVKTLPQEREGKLLHVASLPLEPEPTSSADQISSGLGHLSLGLQKHSHLGK